MYNDDKRLCDMKPFIKEETVLELLEKSEVFPVFILMSTRQYYGIKTLRVTAEKSGITR